MSSKPRSPSLIGVPFRVLLISFLFTLLAFAISMLLGILGTMLLAALRHDPPDLPFVYRRIALPIAVAVGVLAVFIFGAIEVRRYKQSKALAAIERMG
jgi:uncharacterized BrkB/YihY/UPF0761 family membrane protein